MYAFIDIIHVQCTLYLPSLYNVYIFTQFIYLHRKILRSKCYIALFVEHNSIAVLHHPSKCDPLYVEKSYLTPKLVVENNIIRSQTPPSYTLSAVIIRKTPSFKADDVICERPLLPNLSTKTGRNQKT